MPKFDSKRAGATLRRLIHEHGMTPSDFSRRTGIEASQLSRYWNRGMPTKIQPKTLGRLAAGLDMPAQELRDALGYSEDIPVPARVDDERDVIKRHLERIEKELSEIKDRLDLALDADPMTAPDRRNVDRAISAIQGQLDHVRSEVGPEALGQALAILAASDQPEPNKPEPRS